jgi:hypothetical protein
MNTPTTTGKDVLYIDIDDEITAIIDKVRSSHQKIVALVLPKRAAVMQSIVNMKLLKRTADEAKKHIVLITTEAGLLPLAAHVGVHVAKSLQSRPGIPLIAGIAPPPTDDEDESMQFDPKLDSRRPVGEYAATAASPLTVDPTLEDEDTIELDNATPAAASKTDSPLSNRPQPGKDKKLRIPDFNKFRLLLILGGVGVVVLAVGLYLALAVMPKATIAVKTDSNAVQVTSDVSFRTGASGIDVNNAVVPAVQQQVIKTQNQQVEATGQKDVGERATGSMKFYNCNQLDTLAGNDRTIPAGTGVSADGLTFITAESVVVPPSNFDSNNGCKMNKASSAIKVVAQAAGEKYNVDATDYSVAGSSTVTGKGSAMAGGTSKVLKIVQQSDIDAAKQKIATQDSSTVKSELKNALIAKNLFALEGTFAAGQSPEVTPSVSVGTEADVVTVTQKTTYTMLGAKQDDLKKIITEQVNKKIDKNKQNIIEYGLADADFKTQSQQGDSTLVTMNATAIAGSDLNVAEITKQVAGKKSNDAKEIIGAYPGVTQVTVKYSPFWVSSIPKKASKITVMVEKPQVKNDTAQ